MIKICDKRCVIGEGPIWNKKEKKVVMKKNCECPG